MSEMRMPYRTALYVLAACGLLGGGVLAGRCLSAWRGPADRPRSVALLDEAPPACLAQDGIVHVSARDVGLMRAQGMAQAGKLLVAAPPPPPTVQESLQKM